VSLASAVVADQSLKKPIKSGSIVTVDILFVDITKFVCKCASIEIF